MSTIVIPTLHTQMSSFDPYNSAYQYSSSLFTSQEQYVHHNPALSTSGFSPVASLQVDPSWLSSSFHGHASAQQQNIAAGTSAATTQPSAAFLPQTEDVLSLDSSHFTSPIPPLAGARNRTRPLPRRFHSFSTTATTRMQRRTTDPARGAQTNQRISRTYPSPPSAGRQRPSPVGAHFTPSPPLQDVSDARASKRRRTEELLGEQQRFTAPPGPMHVISPTTQQPHNPHLHEHGFGASQTWAGPPTGGHHITSAVLPITGHHGLPPNPVGAPHWPAVGLHYYPATSPHQHAFHESQVSPQDLVQPSIIPYESPTSLSGSPFYPGHVSPGHPLSPSGDSAHSFAKKIEPSSPGFHPDPNIDEFDHPPTEFPPRPYPGGPNTKSPWTPVKPVGKIFGSRLEQMPAIEQRLAKLEEDLDHYLDVRAAQALRNSQLPGLSFDPAPIQAKPTGPSRLFGGRIWPTALARRVRRTPRD